MNAHTTILMSGLLIAMTVGDLSRVMAEPRPHPPKTPTDTTSARAQPANQHRQATSRSEAHSTPPGTTTRQQVRSFLAHIDRIEPSLHDIRAAALRQAGLEGREERRWAKRARWSGALPVLSVRAVGGFGRDRDISRSSSGTEKLDIGTDSDLDIEAKATWNLDRLVFDDVEIRALQAVQRTYRERVQLLSRITSLFYQRRKMQLGAFVTPMADAHKAALHALALAELTSQLDALTGGYFSRESQRRKQR